MGIFKKNVPLPVPQECVNFEVKTESSVCTGEKTIGFFDPNGRRLMYTELVTCDDDIDAFYAKYGLKRS